MPGWKPSCMPPECLQAKQSCEPGAFNSCGSTSPISIVPGYPHKRSRLISRARSEKSLCTCERLVGARFGNPCDVPFRSSGIIPEPSQRKQRKEHAFIRLPGVVHRIRFCAIRDLRENVDLHALGVTLKRDGKTGHGSEFVALALMDDV